MTNSFTHLPTPQILHWLAAGQLTNRLHRSLRMWVLLNKLYGSETNWANYLPQNFTYFQLRDRLFAYLHPKSEKLNSQQITAQCSDSTCICHQTCLEILQMQGLSEPEWQQEILQLTGMSLKQLQQQLKQSPFATVHRSIRDDLKQLTSLGWLRMLVKGQYQCIIKAELPSPSILSTAQSSFTHLSISQTWELLHVLESVAFVQPNLYVIVQSLWEQLANYSTSSHPTQEPQQRIFLHLDYILSTVMQDRVDNYQEQIEQLWRKPPGAMIRFDYWIAALESKVQVTVYPVCLHYLRRAKYLSAYGIDPQGNLAWHNYRLDRIDSEHLQVLAWGDPGVPKQLKEMWHTGNLPTPESIQTELDAAWGFNFYLKRELLILRFPPDFARWYVDNTFRHPSFCAVPYEQLPKLITQNIPEAQQQVLEIVQQRPSSDAYYIAWIRTGDINVLMRLRDWRPNGEVIAPLSIRQQLTAESMEELSNYRLKN